MPTLTTPFRALSIALLCGAGTLAMAQTPVKTSTPAVATESEYVTSKDFKSKVFIVKHRTGYQVRDALRLLGSGFKGTQIEASDREGLVTLTVRDFPENLASIEEALKRLDVPSTAAKEVEFHIHVLFASKTQGSNEECPEELKEVLGTLKSTLQYKSYTLAASFVQRALSEAVDFSGSGKTTIHISATKEEIPANMLKLQWGIKRFQIEPPAEGPSNLKISRFWMQAESNLETLASISTDLSLKDGDKVVVGTSVIKNRGFIVVLTAKVLK